MARELNSMGKQLSLADSLAKEADDARWLAERLRDKADGILEDLLRLHPELERSRKEAEAERNVALLNLVEARKQEQAKQVALEGERSARQEEAAQRHLVEARTDSLEKEKRKTDNLNLQRNSSRLAQNSVAVKGRPAYRGLMAVHALNCMEKAGGEVNSAELVRALHTAMEELERPSPVRVGGLKASPHQLFHEAGTHRCIALGHDGVLRRVDLGNGTSTTMADHYRTLEPGTGRSFLSSDQSAMILTDQKGAILAYSIAHAAMIAKSAAGNAEGSIRSVASWPGLDVVVTGDTKGNVRTWKKAGGRFEHMENSVMGGAIKGMVYDASTDRVVVIAAKGPLWVLAADGTFSEIPLPPGHQAQCMASASKGVLIIGTDRGALVRLTLREKGMTILHEGGGRPVEVITSSPGARRIAYVNAVKELVLLDDGAREVRIGMEAIPTALVLGVEDEVYLGFSDRVDRVLCTSRSMADRICELVGRTWTQAEWNEIGDAGPPEPTCTGF